MALEFQTAQVVLDQGIDTKTDKKLVAMLTRAENCVWSNPGSVRKRHGVDKLVTSDTVTLEAIAACARLISRGQELEINDGHYTWSYSPTRSECHKRYQIPEARTSATSVAQYESSDIISGDMVYFQNAPTIAVTVWCTINAAGNSEIWCEVLDTASGSVITRKLVNTTVNVNTPKCVAVGDFVFIFYVNAVTGATVYGRRLQYTLPANFSVEFTLFADMVGYHYDVCPNGTAGTSWLVAYSRAASVRVVNYSTASPPAVINSTSFGVNGSAVAVAAETGLSAYVAWVDSAGTQLKCTQVTLATFATPWTTVVKNAFVPTTVTLTVLSSTRVQIVAELGTPYTATLTARGIDNTGALLGIEQSYALARIRSKVWSYSGRTYLGIVNGSSAAQVGNNVSDFVVDITDDFAATLKTMRPVGNCRQRLAGLMTRGFIGTVTASASGMYAYVTTGLVKGSATTLQQRYGLDRVAVDLVSSNRFSFAELGPFAHVAAGVPYASDGYIDAEMGFLVAPEQPTYVAAGGGGLSAGNYDYVHCLLAVDKNGVAHRSAPSLPTQVASGAAGKVTISAIQALTLTMRQDLTKGSNLQQINVETYRTKVNSSGPYYNITRLLASEPINDPYGATASVVDTLADTTIATLPTLYTSNGSLSNYQPPPCSIMATHKNCVFVDSLDDGSIWQSKPMVVGEAVAFSEALRYLLPTSERPTAMLSMDDKLVIWTKNRVYVAYGEPFDEKGGGSGLQIQPVAADTGCVDWRSVVLGVDGVYFLSPKGIYLLTRGLQLIYVGAPVEYWTKGLTECGSAELSPDQNEVRFNMLTPTAAFTGFTSQTLVLNYAAKSESAPYGKWSTSNYGPTLNEVPMTAVVTGGAYYFGTAGGSVYSESSGYDDSGTLSTYVSQIVETGVVAPAGLQGFVRARYAGFRLEQMGAHDLKIETVTDPDSTSAYTQTMTLTDTQVAALPREQVGVSIVQQLGSGYKFRITELTPSSAPMGGHEGFRLSGLILDFGVKRGPRRLAAAATG